MLARMMINSELGTAAFCFIAILTVVLPTSADEILLATQQPFRLTENMILVVEDVDPQQGMVWLEIYSQSYNQSYNQSQNETLNSAVLGPGEHFNCSEIDIAVNRIYAGGVGDLVSLEINNEIERSNSRIPSGSPVGSL